MNNTHTHSLPTETDYIAALLHGKGAATPDQMAILEHPRKGARSTLMRINGPAGTGKTFCLLAKLLREAESFPPALQTRGAQPFLFVCFNREMANYARNLLKPFPASRLIHVTTFDSLAYRLAMGRMVNPREAWEAGAPFLSRSPWEVEYTQQSTRHAMQEVAQWYPKLADAYFLDASDVGSVNWVNDELCWLEARYESEEEARVLYPTASRVGRGSRRRPGKEARGIILEIWKEQQRLLAEAKHFTIEQAVKRLMKSPSLPRYRVIAIDEAQDLSMRSIQLLIKMRLSDESRVYLAADEKQRIYQRDYSWGQLAKEAGMTEITRTLRKNLRNDSCIQTFADRLRDENSDSGAETTAAGDAVKLVHGGDDDVLALVADLAKRPDETTMLVGGKDWDAKLRKAGIEPRNPLVHQGSKKRHEVDVTAAGVYVMGELKSKGLEFDNVVVPNLNRFAEDDESEKRLRYVHFTRARRELYVFMGSHEPAWIRKAYPEMV